MWQEQARWSDQGYYSLSTQGTNAVDVRLFVTEKLLFELEPDVYTQIVNACAFPGVKMVVITPDCHVGYGVPVGCVLVTDGTLAMGPVGYDIGCGMISAHSDVEAGAATEAKRLEFNRNVLRRVAMGPGETSKLGEAVKFAGKNPIETVIRGGAAEYIKYNGARVDRSRAERDALPVDDGWQPLWGGSGRPERGVAQLGTLGGGNHFIELQRSEQTGTLFVQVHTGSRGFGHGLATNYFDLAKKENPNIRALDLGYFTPESDHYRDYMNAVAAGANFATVNRLIIFEQVAAAFKEVFNATLHLVYEISHNLVQKEWLPQYGEVWVHRKGSTRAFPAGHPSLTGTMWQDTGHPVLIPGSNRDYSYILSPLSGAEKSAYSVNHGAGRKLSRGEAKRSLDQEMVNDDYRDAGIVVNADGVVPLDESGACYKSSREVIDAVVGAGLAVVEHALWPLASLKASK